jgi:DNA-binding MarR family transcriptional regulator
MMVEEINMKAEIPQLAELAEFRYQLRTFLSFSESASEKCGVATQQYQLLQVIGSVQGERQTSISYIAERMILRHNSTVELVDRAERAGLVERKNDEKDLRRSLVQLTPQGWDVLRRLVAMHLEELQRHTEPMIGALRRVHASAAHPAPDQAGANGQ